MTGEKAPRKALLCFHGTGSKGSIFNVQMAKLCMQLGDTFGFIFLDGPRKCEVGPGILPTFSGQAPYYGWFGGNDMNIDDNLREINASVQRSSNDWRTSNADEDVHIVGAVSFSEGGLALVMMLWQQQEQQQAGLASSTLPRLQFVVVSNCFFPREASTWLTARAQAIGKKTALFDVPTLHIHGNRDFCLGRSRQLVRNHYQPELATVVQVDARHHLPTTKNDIAEVVKHIRRLAALEAA